MPPEPLKPESVNPESDSAKQAAGLLAIARRRRRRLDHLPDSCRPATVDDGYAIQDALVAALGEPVVGWKLGSTSAKAQAVVGTREPFAARLLAPNVHPSPARIARDALFMRALEGEFAFRLARDLPPTAAPYTRETVAAAVAELVPAVEISDSRFNDWKAVGAPSLIADNGNEGAVVLGEPIGDWRALDLSVQRVSMMVNGRRVAEGTGAEALGDPLAALVWLANDRARRGGGLDRGQVIITGSCTGVFMAEPGDRVSADFGALGRVELRFDS